MRMAQALSRFALSDEVANGDSGNDARSLYSTVTQSLIVPHISYQILRLFVS